jgi:hypothetical protein
VSAEVTTKALAAMWLVHTIEAFVLTCSDRDSAHGIVSRSAAFEEVDCRSAVLVCGAIEAWSNAEWGKGLTGTDHVVLLAGQGHTDLVLPSCRCVPCAPVDWP